MDEEEPPENSQLEPERDTLIAGLAELQSDPLAYAEERKRIAAVLKVGVRTVDAAVKVFLQKCNMLDPKPSATIVDFAAAVARLTAKPDFEYSKELADEAERIGIKAKILDRAVRTQRRQAEQETFDANVNATVKRLNEDHCVVREGSKAVVYKREFDPALKRIGYQAIAFEDFRKLLMNRKFDVGISAKGNAVTKNEADIWLEHEDRRQYINGVVFDPSTRGAPDGMLNLWEGFAVTPAEGDWSLLREHILVNICNGVQEHYNFLYRWIARMFQKPGEPAHVAPVLRGKQGVGKSFLGGVLAHILGQHALAISSSKHLVGRFNQHLRNAIFLFADEAFFAGDVANVGTLNALITEPLLTIEGKGKDLVVTPNLLHVLMASNEDWVVPAKGDARRFFVLDVADHVQGDKAYFRTIQDQMDNSGYEAMLYDMLQCNLSDFDHRSAPQTAALQEQRQHSLDTVTAWWQDVLDRGYVYRSKHGLQTDYFGRWHDYFTTELAYNSYIEFAKAGRDRRIISRPLFGEKLRTFGGIPGRRRNGVVGEELRDVPDSDGRPKAVLIEGHVPGYTFGTLHAARAAFLDATKLVIDAWNEDEQGIPIPPPPAPEPEPAVSVDDPRSGEKIIDDFRNQAIRRFSGDRDRANLWMGTVHPRLDRMKPVDVLLTPGGYQRCLNVLQGSPASVTH